MNYEDNRVFCRMVDELVLEKAQVDQELKDGLQWLDERARLEGMDFYDMVYKVLLNHENEKRAKEWRIRGVN